MKQQKIKIGASAAAKVLDEVSSLPEEEKKEVVSKLLANSEDLPNWLVTLLKIIAYAIGIILAGYGTASAATVFLNV